MRLRLAVVAALALPGAMTSSVTIPFSLHETVLWTGRGDTLYTVVLGRTSLMVARGTTKRREAFRLAPFLSALSSGPDGLYAGTAVIKRFDNVPDVLLRIDARTLAIRARASFASRVVPLAQGTSLWASIGDGHVVRLDPRTLAVLASSRTIGELSAPAAGLGSLWVVAKRSLIRLDPMTLAVRSTTTIPRSFGAQGAAVTADADHVELVGAMIAPVAANGTIGPARRAMPGLQTAVVDGARLVGLTFPASLVLGIVAAEELSRA